MTEYSSNLMIILNDYYLYVSQLEDASDKSKAQQRRHDAQLANLKSNHSESFAALEMFEVFSSVAQEAKASIAHVDAQVSCPFFMIEYV